MTGFLIKTLLLLFLLAWTLRKLLRWASRMKGPYGKLAADVERILGQFGQALSRVFFWTLVLTLLMLVGRRAITRWWETREGTALPAAVEDVQPQPGSP